VDKTHVRNLVESYKKYGMLRRTIIVTPEMRNGKHTGFFEIIEGQHGVEAAKLLGLPVVFQVVYGYGENHVRGYNSTLRKWSIEDSLDKFVAKGIKPYKKLVDFMQNHGLSLSISRELLRGELNDKKTNDEFHEGGFTALYKNEADVIGKFYMSVKKLNPALSTRYYIRAIRFMKRNGADLKRLKSRLQHDAKDLLVVKSTQEALINLQNVYNKRCKNKEFYLDKFMQQNA
jgi:hypothetical protein